MRDLRPHRYRLYAVHHGLLRTDVVEAEASVKSSASFGKSRGIDLKMVPLIREVTGTVRGGDGGALANARITMSHHAGPAASFAATSDADGRFTVAWLPRGEYHITCESEGRAKITIPDRKMDEGAGLTLTLPRAATISGRVAVPVGASLPQYTSVLTYEPKGDWHDTARSGLTHAWARPGADGKFTLTNLAPGKYTLYLSSEGVVRDCVTIIVREGENVTAPVLTWREAAKS